MGLASGVTCSFLTRARALAFTAVWSRTISAAKARTAGFLEMPSACLAETMSIRPAV